MDTVVNEKQNKLSTYQHQDIGDKALGLRVLGWASILRMPSLEEAQRSHTLRVWTDLSITMQRSAALPKAFRLSARLREQFSTVDVSSQKP